MQDVISVAPLRDCLWFAVQTEPAREFSVAWEITKRRFGSCVATELRRMPDTRGVAT